MPQLILVLEENLEIQQVISASFKDSDISIVNESDPKYFFKKVRDEEPDLVFLTNSDSSRDYGTCREIRNDPNTKNIPIILLVNAKDQVEDKLLSELRINGLLRKPFESTKLREQLSPYIDLDENFGNGPEENDEDYRIDMSSIDDQLQEIKHAKSASDSDLPQEGIGDDVTKVEGSKNIRGDVNLTINEMDSLVLENISDPEEQEEESVNVARTSSEESVLIAGESEKIQEEKIEEDIEEIVHSEINMDSGFEFELKLDEEELEGSSVPDDSEATLLHKQTSRNGLEKLKNSGLENQFAESRLDDQNEEIEEKIEGEMTEIDLEVNDFEEQNATWHRPSEIDLYHETPREGLTDINLDESDFQSEFLENSSSFGDQQTPSDNDFEEIIDEDESIILNDTDNIELEQNDSEEDLGLENFNDNTILVDSTVESVGSLNENQDVKKLEDDTSYEFDSVSDDSEIKSMVQDSFNVQEDFEKTGLEELEDLNEQMGALEPEGIDLEPEGIDLEPEGIDLESEEAEFESEEAEFESEEAEFELEEAEFESEEVDLESEEVEFEEDLHTEKVEKSGTGIDLDEDVFENWDEAEDAFLSFNRKTPDSEKITVNPEMQEDISNRYKDEQDEFEEEAESYRFTEEELKDIVSSSVKKALEKSIASSLVELAVSELKSKVTQMDQDWA